MPRADYAQATPVGMPTQRLALWLAWTLVFMGVCVHGATSSSSSSSSASALLASSASSVSKVPPPSNSSNRFGLPTVSTASYVSASTGIAPQYTAAPVAATNAQPYQLEDSVTVRSRLDTNATDGLFFAFNTTADLPIWFSLSLCNGPGIPAYNTSNATLLEELGLTSFQARVATLVSMYVSTDVGTTRPGPDHSVLDSQIGWAQGGWTQVALKDGADKGAWIGVWPPSDPRGVNGTFEIQISASTRGPMENVAARPGLLFDDTDRASALVTSFNYTAPAPNISLIVLPTTGDFSLQSITYFNSSFCRIFDLWEEMRFQGLQPAVNSSETSRGTVNVMTRGSLHSGELPTPDINDTAGVAPLVPDNDGDADDIEDVLALWPRTLLPRAVNSSSASDTDGQVRKQFYVSGLTPATNYTAYLVASVNVTNTVLRTLYPAIKFVTKQTPNCKLMYDLDFCPELAYSVPYNPAMSNEEALRVLENIVSSNYGNFSATLQTFPCESDDFGLYSSVTTCEDCRRAYQTWLCAVAIPRCTDLVDPSASAASQNGTDLEGLPMPPNRKLLPYVVNRVGPMSSRQPYIDKIFNPGDYGELLPCIQTCEMVTRSCPPVLQWACPGWTVTAQRDYGTFADAGSTGLDVGQNGGAGPDGQRFGGTYSRYVAQDAFGHVYCNSLDVDRLLRQASSARRTAPMVHGLAHGVALAAVAAWLIA